LPEHAQDLIRGGDWHLDVADATGLILFRLDIQATDAPAMRPDPMMPGRVRGSSAAPAAGPRNGPIASDDRARRPWRDRRTAPVVAHRDSQAISKFL